MKRKQRQMRQDEENEDVSCVDFQRLYAETIRLAQQKVRY
jgi:hypothetical protein